VVIGVFILTSLAATAGDLQPTCLRCEHLVDPLGIDTRQPRLSWQLESAARGQRQAA